MAIQVLVVDDHEIVREGVRSLVGASRAIWKLTEAADGEAALRSAQELKPDLIVMDITMPGASGLDVVSDLRKLRIACPVLMFTMHDSARLGIEAQQAGAQGYVVKTQAARDLIKAMEVLLAGGTFFGGQGEAQTSEGDEPKRGPLLCLDLGFAWT